MVQWILRFDVDVDQCTNYGESVLSMASQYGHTDIVKLLLKRDACVNLVDIFHRGPLYMASHQGHTDIVKLLLERDACVNLTDPDGRGPLLQASHQGHTDIVKLLLERNTNVNIFDNDGYSPLIRASLNGDTDIVRLLLERNPDPCDNTTLSTSGVNIIDSPSLVQPLMKHKPDINAQTFDGGNALYFSAIKGNIEITHLLLENKADSNICINSKQYITDTLHNHPKNTSSSVTQYVSKKSTDYAFDVVAGSSPLHIACFMGRIDVVRCLLDHNANINMTKEDGTTPLFYACEVEHSDIVHLLLDKGADTQICRLDGKSPLNIATDNGNSSIIIMLTNHTKKEEIRSN
ncbi:unnamed protein product [Mytilus edulis]|uniref:Uncharacterized protein n=1 Tax=Mytilus edulis TaxID=6550 RepID=A0A8S3V9C8_MYTED|nr:unnamed protein product [Mytilus edulis]